MPWLRSYGVQFLFATWVRTLSLRYLMLQVLVCKCYHKWPDYMRAAVSIVHSLVLVFGCAGWSDLAWMPAAGRNTTLRYQHPYLH